MSNEGRNTKMHIIVSGIKKEVSAGTTLIALIKQEQIESPDYVTVSVNGGFVDRQDFEATVLHDGDEVEFLYFMGGGRDGFDQ